MFIAVLLAVILLLVALMNLIGWSARFFGSLADQRLAITRIWRINLGVALIVVLSQLSLLLEKYCGANDILAKFCGS